MSSDGCERTERECEIRSAVRVRARRAKDLAALLRFKSDHTLEFSDDGASLDVHSASTTSEVRPAMLVPHMKPPSRRPAKRSESPHHEQDVPAAMRAVYVRELLLDSLSL